MQSHRSNVRAYSVECAHVAQREQEPSLPAATAGAQTKEKARMGGEWQCEGQYKPSLPEKLMEPHVERIQCMRDIVYIHCPQIFAIFQYDAPLRKQFWLVHFRRQNEREQTLVRASFWHKYTSNEVI